MSTLFNNSNSIIIFIISFSSYFRRIYQHYINLEDWFITRIKNDTKAVDALKKFFTEQDIYMRNMIKTNVPGSPFWRHVSYILAQYDGLVAGYKAVAPNDQVLHSPRYSVIDNDSEIISVYFLQLHLM